MPAETVICEKTAIDGVIDATCDVRVDGTVRGQIRSTGTVTIMPSGSVRATIRGRSARIGGEVVGDISCTESIAVDSGGRVVGDLRAPDIAINPGGEIEGSVDIVLEAAAPRQSVATRTRRSPANEHTAAHRQLPTPPRPSGRLLLSRKPQ